MGFEPTTDYEVCALPLCYNHSPCQWNAFVSKKVLSLLSQKLKQYKSEDSGCSTMVKSACLVIKGWNQAGCWAFLYLSLYLSFYKFILFVHKRVS